MDLSSPVLILLTVVLGLLILLAGGCYYFLSRLADKVKQGQERLLALATIDDLTHLYNRRYFFHRFLQEFERAKRYQRPLSCLILDIDHFKLVNDTYGHLAGDRVLQEIAQILQRQCRRSDLVGRYGGEEMIILLPETDADGALAIAERIRELIKNHTIRNGQGQAIRVTVSVGVAHFPGPALPALSTPDIIVQHADDALLQAKRRGRNRTVLSEAAAWQGADLAAGTAP